MDIKNITDYFRKKGVTTLSERSAFDFITAENTSLDGQVMETTIETMLLDGKATEAEGEVDERVFRQAYIPKTLFEVIDPERDTGIVQEGGKDDLIYAKFLDVQETKAHVPELANHEDEKGEEDGESESESDEDEESLEEPEEPGKPRGKRHEDKEAKKERKQKVKEEARERRKGKIPKAEKKRKIKITKKGK
jgi:RIO kinase 1